MSFTPVVVQHFRNGLLPRTFGHSVRISLFTEALLLGGSILTWGSLKSSVEAEEESTLYWLLSWW